MTDASSHEQNNQHSELAKQLRPYVFNSEKAKPGQVFLDWLSNALNTYGITRKPSAFAPLTSYFATQQSFEESFLGLLDQVVPKSWIARVGNLLEQGLSNGLEKIHDHISTETERLDNFLFELFDVLYTIDPERSFGWAERAVETNAFSMTLTSGGDLAPLALYWKLVRDETTGPKKRGFYVSLLNWSIANQRNPSVPPASRDIFPAAFQAVAQDSGSNGANSQIELLERCLATGQEGPADHLLALIEDVILEEELLVEEPLIATEARKLRNKADPMVPGLIREFSDERKKKWQSSYVLSDAFSDELQITEAACDGIRPCVEGDQVPSIPDFNRQGSMLYEIRNRRLA